MNSGVLYLIPVPLGEGNADQMLPIAIRDLIAGLKHYIVERPKTARKFLKLAGCLLPLTSIKMQVLDEHTHPRYFSGMLAPLRAGNNVGLLSEAGCPAVADPGAGLVRLAHRENIRVVPLVGPSSIMLALMASGLNGQRFVFHGYLPRGRAERTRTIAELEKESTVRDQTQIFMETPYRNQKLVESVISGCQGNTLLSIACNLTLPDEYIRTRTVQEWKRSLPDIAGRPAIFLLQGEPDPGRFS